MMLINGKSATQIDALDRGLCYGDGLFETLAVLDGQPQLWPQHIHRLKTGCSRLNIVMPAEELLLQETLALCRMKGHEESRAVVKITLTRGQSGRGYRGHTQAACNRIIARFSWPDYPQHYASGIKLRWCDTRLGLNPALAGIKHLNRLEQVLARNEWSGDDVVEGLMLDQQGHVIEGTMSNLFIIKEGVLLTAAIDQSGVAGIIRQLICDDTISHGVPVIIRSLTKEQVISADEVFVCNSLIGIWPVQALLDESGQQNYDIGPISQKIVTALQSYQQSP